jgi:imidazolonepropionase-like amidohydrolase
VPSPSSAGPESEAGSLALVGATIHPEPTEEPIRDGVVLIRGETIAAVGRRSLVPIPPAARILDCTGLTIAAGFWNSHVHFFERKWADAMTIPACELDRQLQETLTRYGFTSVFDLGSMWENTRALRDRVERGEVSGPSIRSTGEALVPPGALPSARVLGVMGLMQFPAPEVADAAAAAAAARRLLDAGVDGIKVFASSPGATLAEETIRAAVREAHRSGKPVFVHPNSGDDARTAVGAGVDVVAHTTPRSGPWDEPLLALMKERRVALTATLTLWQHFLRHDRASVRDQVVDTGVGQLGAWVAAGGTVLFGTDLGAVDPDPGAEYALMARAGMTFPQILASLTTAPAQRFGEPRRRGRVAPGFQADLAVLGDDPSRDIQALAAVRYTLRDGKVLWGEDA